MDLVFPHHENEIAQSCAACDSSNVSYWIHNGFVTVDSEKMSKSLGNFFTIRQVSKQASIVSFLPVFFLLITYMCVFANVVGYRPLSSSCSEAFSNGNSLSISYQLLRFPPRECFRAHLLHLSGDDPSLERLHFWEFNIMFFLTTVLLKMLVFFIDRHYTTVKAF